MDTQAIFGLQLFLSLVVWGVIAKWLLTPWLEKMSLHEALFCLTLPHAFRHIGMVSLSLEWLHNRCQSLSPILPPTGTWGPVCWPCWGSSLFGLAGLGRWRWSGSSTLSARWTF